MLAVTAAEMAQLDRTTIEKIGIPGIVLMENAARGAARFFTQRVPQVRTGRVTIVAGSGNNAGDGFVLARLFSEQGARVRVVCLKSPEQLRGDALTNFQILGKLRVPVQTWDAERPFEPQFEAISQSDVLIDAILGTGLNSEVRGLYRDIIDAMNATGLPILAVDLPSGLDATTAIPLGTAIKATATATFGQAKIGLLIAPGETFTGRLQVIDIGIPARVVAEASIRRWVLDQAHLQRLLAPRDPETHKGHAGHAAVLAGSPGKTGAAALACLGAARVGAGLVTHLVPKGLNPIMEVKLTEAMTFPVEETGTGCAAPGALADILTFLEGKQAMAAGPGISLDPGTARLLKELLLQTPCPLVLDADALTILSSCPDRIRQARSPIVLTPHPGEMARLAGLSTAAIQADRIGSAARFSRDHNVFMVLKGHRTIIAAPDGRLAINGSGNPAMASGGMGDVLTGMIAGWLAQGYEPFDAACLGVFIHGAAADHRFGKTASRGLLAGDLLEAIPEIIGSLERNR